MICLTAEVENLAFKMDFVQWSTSFIDPFITLLTPLELPRGKTDDCLMFNAKCINPQQKSRNLMLMKRNFRCFFVICQTQYPFEAFVFKKNFTYWIALKIKTIAELWRCKTQYLITGITTKMMNFTNIYES